LHAGYLPDVDCSSAGRLLGNTCSILDEVGNRIDRCLGLLFKCMCWGQQIDHLTKVIDPGILGQQERIGACQIKRSEPHIISVDGDQNANQEKSDRDSAKSNQACTSKFQCIDVCTRNLDLRGWWGDFQFLFKDLSFQLRFTCQSPCLKYLILADLS